jgi:hypothetical protein
MLVLILGVMVWIILCTLYWGPLGSTPSVTVGCLG